MADDGEPGGPGDIRTDAREQSIMLLYEAEQRDVSPMDLFAGRTVASAELTRMLVGGVERLRPSIDAHIVDNARGWVLERMPALDRAVLRLAIFELMERGDVPTAVVIDEAVELAKRFSTDDSSRFVNGVLAAVARQVRSTDA
jgi:N utilization substance protein B